MKLKLSISIEEKLVKQVEEILHEGRFRNKSHIMEYSLKKFLNKEL